MKKITLILLLITSVYSYGQTIYSNNIYTRMQIQKGWFVVQDTCQIFKRDTDSCWFTFYGDTLRLLPEGTPTNFAGSASASGPDYAVQFKDPSGGLQGSPKLIVDTIGNSGYLDLYINGDIYSVSTGDGVGLLENGFEGGLYSLNADQKIATLDLATNIYNYANGNLVYYGDGDSIVAPPLSGSGTRNVEVTATGKLIASSSPRYNAHGTSVGLRIDDDGTASVTEVFDEFNDTYSISDLGGGSYVITSASNIFTEFKTYATFTPGWKNQYVVFTSQWGSETEVLFRVFDAETAHAPVDDYMGNSSSNIMIIITVYP